MHSYLGFQRRSSVHLGLGCQVRFSYTGINPPYAEQFGSYSNIVQCDDQIMNVHIKRNCLIPILSTLVKYYVFQTWKQLQVTDSTSAKITTVPRLFSEHFKMKTNIRLWMYTPNGTVWYPLCLLWSSITCFRPENVSYKLPILQVVKLQLYLDYFQNTPKWKPTSDYECTHQMELFDTHFVYFGQVLLVSGPKNN